VADVTWRPHLAAFGEPIPQDGPVEYPFHGPWRGELRATEDSAADGNENALPYWYCPHEHTGPGSALAAGKCARAKLAELEEAYKAQLIEQGRRIDRGQGGSHAAEELVYDAMIFGLNIGRMRRKTLDAIGDKS
jgi:hypothetical protein